jgi:hypothetical protein
MLIGRGDGRPAYLLTVAPLRPDLAIGDRPLAMIVIVDPERHSPSGSELIELFGFSPAEARLATALMTGKTLTETSPLNSAFGSQLCEPSSGPSLKSRRETAVGSRPNFCKCRHRLGVDGSGLA